MPSSRYEVLVSSISLADISQSYIGGKLVGSAQDSRAPIPCCQGVARAEARRGELPQARIYILAAHERSDIGA